MKIYTTTDTHLGHSMLVENKHRELGFEKQILRNLSKISGDLFVHCGDICIGKDEEHNKEIIDALIGFKKKILVRGNHDNKSYSWYYEHGWDFVCEMFRMRYLGKEVLFSHMPVLVEEASASLYHKVDINIHGHLHGAGYYSHRKVKGYDGLFNYDIAPDTHNYKPVSVEDVLRFIS